MFLPIKISHPHYFQSWTIACLHHYNHNFFQLHFSIVVHFTKKIQLFINSNYKIHHCLDSISSQPMIDTCVFHWNHTHTMIFCYRPCRFLEAILNYKLTLNYSDLNAVLNTNDSCLVKKYSTFARHSWLLCFIIYFVVFNFMLNKSMNIKKNNDKLCIVE